MTVFHLNLVWGGVANESGAFLTGIPQIVSEELGLPTAAIIDGTGKLRLTYAGIASEASQLIVPAWDAALRTQFGGWLAPANLSYDL